MKRMIVRKILQLLRLMRMLWCFLLKSKSVSMLLIMMLSELLILSPPPYYPYEGVVYHVQSKRLWYSENG